MPKVLIIDDDVDFALLMRRYLGKNGFETSEEFTAHKALQNLKDNKYDLILTDVKLPDGSGIDLLKQIKKLHFETPVILITGYGDLKLAVSAMKLGAADFITKPIQHEELLLKIKSLTSEESRQKSKKKNTEFSYIEGSSSESQNVVKQSDLVATTDFSVLILGESGTGKEFVAKRIHHKSKRKDKPFIAIDCGALPEELAGSELFGHLKGSFTGALKDKKGHFEEGNGGTIFLDEVGNLSYENQIKLLRVLQERKIKRIGSSKDINIDVRIIAATNENLKDAIEKGNFREDLFFRLNEFKVELSPLRNRIDDIQDFIQFFLNDACNELGKQVDSFSAEAMDVLKNHAWPGNLRELKNVVRRSVLLCPDSIISKNVLPEEIQHSSIMQSANDDIDMGSRLKNASAEAERDAIIKALSDCHFNKTKAAKMLKIDRKTLYNKIHSYGIELNKI
ncbi:MAG: sigma-54 dependent transcriptional regulator [Flavobacteriales bacterium]|nr:sigma-54 dependent transcriptional regulator [Flavobacteriales bacterium]